MNKLAILGASGHGKVVADCAECCGWSQIAFFDDAWPKMAVNGRWPVIGTTENLITSLSDFDGVIVAIGNNHIRHQKLLKLADHGANIVTLLHPSAQISKYASMGSGSVAFACSVVNVDVSVGMGSIINTCASVDHDCLLGAAVHISPGARIAGGVSIGDRSWIGIGATVKQLITIGTDVIVGAGAVVVGNTQDAVTVMGVPAVQR